MKNFYFVSSITERRSFLMALLFLISGVFSVQVNAATAYPDVFLVRKNQPFTFNVSANDVLTGCAGTLNYSISASTFVTQGTLAFINGPADPNATYTPATDMVGVDSMRYQITCSAEGAASIVKSFAMVVDDTDPHQYYVSSGGVQLSMFPFDDVHCRYAVYTDETGGTALSTNEARPLIPSPVTGATYWVEAQFRRFTNPTPGWTTSINRIPVVLGRVGGAESTFCNLITPIECSVKGKLLAKQDFGTGTDAVATATTLPAGATTYNFVSNKHPVDGKYSLVKNSADGTSDAYPAWIKTYTDHTGGGYMMMVNANDVGDRFYSLMVDGLCPNVRLNFSAWIGNLVIGNDTYRNKANPNLRFDVREGGPDGALVAQYYTGSIPKVAGVEPNKWRQYGFNFTNGSYSTLYFAIYNLETDTDGNDLVLDDIAVNVCMPTTTISGIHNYCPDTPMNLQSNYVDDGTLGASYRTHWLYSEDVSAPIEDWEVTSVTGTINNTTATPGYYRAVVGNTGNFTGDYSCCSVSEPFQVAVSAPLMYWKRNTTNKDWNDPNNWEDADGISLNAVPSSCTDVHIPGNAAFYPSLYSDTTIHTDVYGAPECHDIYFHFGSEVARTDLLTYHYAFVQYNFGYYTANDISSITNGDVANNGNLSYSAEPMKRGQWYALSAPLKKIGSGDFSVGGFPNMWQQSFKSSPNQSGAAGEWYTPKNTNSWDIGTQHNAISIWAGEYLPGELGEDDHTNLNALKGIFEMPYFENGPVSTLHRIHSYSGGVSSFKYYYYKIPGLPLAGEGGYPDYPAGTLARGEESYRFIFDGNLTINGTETVYKVTVPAGTDVMIGNPFLSSLVFSKFYNMNSANIENYYRLFEGTVPNPYTYTLGNQDLIASFQAFFIKTKGTGTVDLYFPVNASVTRGQNATHQLKSSETSELKENVLQLTASNAKANSNVFVSLNSGLPENNVPQLFINDPSSDNSLQFYVKNEEGMKNAIQFETGENVEVRMGIVSKSKEAATIHVANAEHINASSLLLTDLKTNKTINLLETSSYDFVNDPDFTGERFILTASKSLSPTGILSVDAAFEVNVVGHELKVWSSVEISEVSVFSPQGICVDHVQSVASYNLTRQLNIISGVYIVSVKLTTGKVKNMKVVIP